MDEDLQPDPALVGFPLWKIHHGLLHLSLHSTDSAYLMEQILQAIRTLSRRIIDEVRPHREVSLEQIARFARMAYELGLSQALSDLSQEDVETLDTLPLDGVMEILCPIINRVRHKVRRSGIDDTLEGHRMAKSIHTVWNL